MGSGHFDGAAPSLRVSLPPTAAVGKYRLIAELGSGGMANVYLAVMRGRNDFNKLVVLKSPREVVTEDPTMLTMFLDEARLAARLNHRNVVQTYEIIEESGRDIIVMEYLEGQTLNEILLRGRRTNNALPLDLHLRIIVEALNGLHYAHELKDYDGRPLELVHRDVSPHNIFVTFDGEVKVLDFGIAKAAISSHVTQAGTFKGKVRYMPPEQFAGEGIDRRADVFALGAVLWEAAVGKKLWTGVSDADVLTNVVNGAIPAPRDVNPEVDERLDAIVRRALAPERTKRYATCRELQTDLEKLLEAMGGGSLNDAATHVSKLFSETRAARQRIIESQLRIVANKGDGSDSIPGDPPRPIALKLPVGEIGLTPSQNELRPAAAATPESPSTVRRRALWLGLVALGLLGFVFVAARQGQNAVNVPPTPSAPATNAQTTSEPAGSAEPQPAPTSRRELNLSISTKPVEARLYLDERDVGSTPFQGTFPRDGASHALRIEANGYRTETMNLVFDSDKQLAILLEKRASSGSGARAKPTAPATSSRTTGTSSGATTAPSAPEAKPTSPTETRPPTSGPKRPERPIDEKL